jgi:hypothetical protein
MNAADRASPQAHLSECNERAAAGLMLEYRGIMIRDFF